MFGLARCSFGKGDYAEAEQLASAVFESDRRLRGQEHSDTLSGARMLARIYLAEGKLTQAESLMTNTLQTLVRTLGSVIQMLPTIRESWPRSRSVVAITQKPNRFGGTPWQVRAGAWARSILTPWTSCSLLQTTCWGNIAIQSRKRC
jgi:hypothetical protein